MRNRNARRHAPPPPARRLLAAAALLLGACVNETAAGPSLPPLAQDREQPALALIEHVLAEHFAGAGAGADPPTTCVALSPDALTAEQEEALIARFPRLAPRDRCETRGAGQADAITGERAVLVQVYGFECSDAANCSAWVSRPASPAMRYEMRFAGSAWRFTGDRRVLAD